MFTADLIETSRREVELFDINGQALSEIVNFIYTSQINIKDDNVQNIFTAASLLELSILRDICSEYMSQELCLANCVSVYQFASFHQCSSLETTSRSYVVNHFYEVLECPHMYTLSSEDLANLISEDNLNVKQEESVFEFVMRWIETDIEERLRYLPSLFKHVRVALISDYYISENISGNEMVMTNSFCKSILAMTKLYNISKDDGEDTTKANFDLPVTPRLGMYMKKMMIFVGGSQEKNQRAFTGFDPMSGRNFYSIPLHVNFDFKYRIDYHRAVAGDKNEVYIIGGIFYEDHHFEESGKALNEVKLFDPYKQSWFECSYLKTPRCAHAVVNYKGLIYVMGGMSTFPNGTPLSSAECYDPEKDCWRNIEPMPVGLYSHQAVVRDDKIYVIGGFTATGGNRGATNAFLEYDPALDTWRNVHTVMQVSRAEFGAALLGNQLHVIGGRNGENKLSSVEIFDFSTLRWKFGDDFPEDRNLMATIVFDGCIYVCGGVRTLISRVNRSPRVVETKDLWKYDPKVGCWDRAAKLVQYANVHGCVVCEVNVKRLHESEFISHPPN